MCRVRYYIRLDDACPTMNFNRWSKVLSILDEHNIKPLIGIIPDNKDDMMDIDPPLNDFWGLVRCWQEKGYAIALHGYQHLYHTINRKQSMNKAGVYSEFAGLPYHEQELKLQKGWRVFMDNRVTPEYFFAPSHTFDCNTIQALKNVTNIKFISDTMGLFPYDKSGFTFVPQQLGSLKRIRIPGCWTICLHPNSMEDCDILNLSNFIKLNQLKFSSFDFHINRYKRYPLVNILSKYSLDFIKSIFKYIKK